MLRLAVTSEAETYQRLRDVLPERGIEVEHLQVDERTVQLPPASSPWGDGDFDVGFVFPSRLMEGSVADALLGIPWVNDREAVLTSRNKAGVLASLAAADLPVPRSVLVSNPVGEEDLLAAAERIGYPVVIKPNSTTRGVGVARAGDADTLLGIADYLELVHDFRATADKSYLVQEFVPAARDIRIMIIDGTYVGAVERARSDEDGRWKHNVHRGATATGVSPEPAVRRLAERAAETLDIPFLGVDVLVTQDGPVLSETNARPTIDLVEKYESDFLDRLVSLIERTAE